ncbi:MAG: L,D-transpeptidase family protein [Alphaproteobacteria bacterium]|nr:L,D-transpeptidase family protein [Alphaproteobacteria bacterium]
MSDLEVDGSGFAAFGGQLFRCAIGKGGLRADKREGDGATPAGVFALRELLYRPDREKPPVTGLPARALAPGDGWCDAPEDAAYNRPVRLPYTARAEDMWRADGLYDLVVVVGYNDDPVVPGRGSAIFVHIARPGYAPTEGCVAFTRADLALILRAATPQTRLVCRG